MLLKHIKKRWPVALLLLLDIGFFGTTDPTRVAAPMVMVGFSLIVANLYLAIRALLSVATWYGVSFGSHARRVAAVVTGAMGGIVALQSVGQLSPRDTFVMLPFALLLYMYTSYGDRATDP